MLVMVSHEACERRAALAGKAVIKLLRDLEAMREDRDAWKQAHEDLLEVRRQDIAALTAKIAALKEQGAQEKLNAPLRNKRHWEKT